MPRFALVAIGVVAWLAAACTLPPTGDADTNVGAAPDGEGATFVRVDDGDSFVALVAGREERVRLIGVNAPERGECLADTARERLRELLENRQLLLVSDADQTDRFDRLLRYVFVGDVLVNETLVEEGLLLAQAFEPNTSLQETLDSAERDAQEQRLGIWDPEACGAVLTSVVIADIEEDPPGRDLSGEYIEIVNVGPEVDLSGWSIRDETSQNRFVFPTGTSLGTQARLRIYSGCGTATVSELYWCSPTPIWNNSGDTAFLVTPTGAIQASSSYGP